VQRIYNCAHPRYFPLRRAPTERHRGEEPLRVLAVGRLHSVKNHRRLIEAFQHVVDGGMNAELTIVGSGPLEEELRREIATRSLSGRVHLLGFHDDVRPLLLSAHLYVLPSLSEGCSISLIEALATGLPAVGSDVPGVHEVLGPDLARDALFDPGDTHAIAARIREMLSRPPDELAERAKACQERVYGHFSPSAYLQNLETLYADTWREATQASDMRPVGRRHPQSQS
jgi:glycosyltransferase involved in cell wall biosynthesis